MVSLSNHEGLRQARVTTMATPSSASRIWMRWEPPVPRCCGGSRQHAVWRELAGCDDRASHRLAGGQPCTTLFYPPLITSSLYSPHRSRRNRVRTGTWESDGYLPLRVVSGDPRAARGRSSAKSL